MVEVVADVFDVLGDDAAEWGCRVGRHCDVVYRIIVSDVLSSECKMP